MGATALELTWSMTSLNAPPMSLCSQFALLTLIHNNYVISKSWSSFESKMKIRRLSSRWLCPSFNYSLWGLAYFWCQPQVPNQSTAVWGGGVGRLSFSPGCFPLFKLCHQQNFIQLSWRQFSCHHMNKVCTPCHSKTTGWQTDHDKSCYVDLVLLVKPRNILLFIATRAAWAVALHFWH